MNRRKQAERKYKKANMRKQTRENKYEKKTPDEESLIRHIRDQTASLVPSGFTGIGDDCAVLPLNAKESTLVSTDALVDGTHFLKEHITPEDLGHKALAVNLSDIAGMGGKAVGSFFSVGIPPETETAFLRKLLKGYRRLSEKYAVPLLGGDTVRSDKGLWLNITVIGTGAPKKIKLRSAAEEGDLICLNGPVGDAAAGLDLILASVAGEKADPQTGETPPSRTARLRPEEKNAHPPALPPGTLSGGRTIPFPLQSRPRHDGSLGRLGDRSAPASPGLRENRPHSHGENPALSGASKNRRSAKQRSP